jgi:hypothetical protein
VFFFFRIFWLPCDDGKSQFDRMYTRNLIDDSRVIRNRKSKKKNNKMSTRIQYTENKRPSNIVIRVGRGGSCSTCVTRRVTLVTNPMISHNEERTELCLRKTGNPYLSWSDNPELVFLDRGLQLTRKLLEQGFLVVKLKSLLRKFYVRHHDMVNKLWIIGSTEIWITHMQVVLECCYI